MNAQTPIKPSAKALPALPSVEEFGVILAETPGLIGEVQKQTVGLYQEVTDFLAARNMRIAQAALAKLLQITEDGPAQYLVRRDGSSTYTHQLSQAIYRIWSSDHPTAIQHRVKGSLERGHWLNRTFNEMARDIRALPHYRPEQMGELEADLVLNFLHDAGEEYRMEPRELSELIVATAEITPTWCTDVTQSFDNITHRKDQGETAQEFNIRVGLNDRSLRVKLYDRIQNLSSWIGSGRGEEKTREYIGNTRHLIVCNFERIASDAQLFYLADYLSDQCELLELYWDVKTTKPELVTKLIDDMLTYDNRYASSSISPDIHPMRSIVRRINDDVSLWDNRSAPGIIPVTGPLPPPADGRRQPALRKAS